MNQIFCPKCFARFAPEKRQLVCRSGDCAKRGIPFPEDEAVLEEGQQPHCSGCGREITTRLCPFCGYELGGQAAGDGGLTGISLVGAAGVGKSHFLTVLLHTIKEEMSKAYDCALYPIGGDVTLEQYQRNYYTPLYVEGRCIPSTERDAVEPLIYSLVFADGGKHGVNTSLTFYDACGANFESERTMEDRNRDIYNSKGIIFLIDPTQFEEIRKQRAAQGRDVCEGDPVTLLSRMVHLIRNGSGQSDLNQKINVPIAVCITKMDILKSALDVSSFLRGTSRHLRQPLFDKIDFNSCNLEIISLIESWAGKELVTQVDSQFEHYGFFAFSSLGSEPTQDGRVNHIVPHRIMDPFLWILAQNGIIKTVGE